MTKRKTANTRRSERPLVIALEALCFYANPKTYFAIGFFPDPPCRAFLTDFGKTHLGVKPGRRARKALLAIVKLKTRRVST